MEYGKPILVQERAILEVGCRAKIDLQTGTRLDGIGGHHLYGVLEEPGNLPIGIAENTLLLRSEKRDEKVTWDDVRFPSDDPRLALWKEQTAMEA